MKNIQIKSIIFSFVMLFTFSSETEIGFNIDNYESPLSGSRNISSAVNIGSAIFDEYVPNNILVRTGIIYVRAISTLTLTIINHEYYGHGFAFKNIGAGLKEIKLFSNIFGLGIVQLNSKEPLGAAINIANIVDKDDIIFKTISGSQANTFYSQQQILQNFHKDKVNSYLMGSIAVANIDQSLYFNIGKNNFNSDNIRLDTLVWKNKINEKYGKEVITINDFYISSLPLINSLTYTLIKNIFQYVAYGESYTDWVCFKKGDIKYLPNIRTETSPFGLVYAFDNYLSYHNRSFLLSLSGLNDPLERFLFTVDVRTHNLFQSKHIDFDLRFVAARQPINDTEDSGTFFGYMIQPSIRLKLDRFKIYMDYTNKNDVFIPATYFKKGHYFNIGLSLTV